MDAIEQAVKDVRIDVTQIPESVRRMMVASLLKAFMDWKRREAELEKEKAPS
ncbi:MAG: hypothetical protein IKN00_04325 [Bacteroidales bacterium]|nr:hypothetical protein [Bacteroidales bacterium]